MAVAVDVTGTKLIGTSSVSTVNYSGITVGPSLSNGALTATLVLGVSAASAPSAIWDSGGTNQTMTLIGSATLGSNAFAAIFGLRNPTSGNKTLKFSWTGANFPSCCAISFTGVNQTSDAAAFAHFNSATGTGNQSLVITSAVGNIAVAACGTVTSLTSFSGTNLYLDTTSSGDDSAASRQAGASTVTFSMVGSGNGALVGVDVVAAAAGASFIAKNNIILQAVKRASYW